MQRLVMQGTWQVNGEKSRLWLGPDGLYLIWPNGATEIVRLLEKDELPGIPRSPDTIAALLLEAGVIEGNEGGGALFEIQPPGSELVLKAVRFSSPTILLSCLDKEVAPTRQALLGERRKDVGTGAPVAAVPASTVNAQVADAEGDSDGTGRGQDGETPASPTVTRTAQSTTTPASPAAPEYKLDAPARLNPAVRSALSEVVNSLNLRGSEALCCSVPSGIFVPLRELQRRGADGALAVRALAEMGMLAAGESAGKTIQHRFYGETILGVVISPRFVRGFDAELFKS
jgi:conjugal transfer pilus assembly protein TraI